MSVAFAAEIAMMHSVRGGSPCYCKIATTAQMPREFAYLAWRLFGFMSC